MSNPARELIAFAVEQLPKAPLATQAKVCRAIAALSGSAAERADFIAQAASAERLAAEQEEHARRNEQLSFDFRRRARRTRGNGGNGAGKN